MAIYEFRVTQPQTSAELAERARTAVDEEDVAARGLLHLVVIPKREVPAPLPEGLDIRIRSQEFDAAGNMRKILGTGVLHAGTEASIPSESVIITLAPDGIDPAEARAVQVQP